MSNRSGAGVHQENGSRRRGRASALLDHVEIGGIQPGHDAVGVKGIMLVQEELTERPARNIQQENLTGRDWTVTCFTRMGSPSWPMYLPTRRLILTLESMIVNLA